TIRNTVNCVPLRRCVSRPTISGLSDRGPHPRLADRRFTRPDFGHWSRFPDLSNSLLISAASGVTIKLASRRSPGLFDGWGSGRDGLGGYDCRSAPACRAYPQAVGGVRWKANTYALSSSRSASLSAISFCSSSPAEGDGAN